MSPLRRAQHHLGLLHSELAAADVALRAGRPHPHAAQALHRAAQHAAAAGDALVQALQELDPPAGQVLPLRDAAG